MLCNLGATEREFWRGTPGNKGNSVTLGVTLGGWR